MCRSHFQYLQPSRNGEVEKTRDWKHTRGLARVKQIGKIYFRTLLENIPSNSYTKYQGLSK